MEKETKNKPEKEDSKIKELKISLLRQANKKKQIRRQIASILTKQKQRNKK